MAIYFTADQHYGGDDIRIYYERPFVSVEAMDKIMIARHNVKVKPDDTVIVVGDFWQENRNSWQHYKDKLNGRLYILEGNHSRKHCEHIISAVVVTPFSNRDENSDIYENRAFITHDPLNADWNYLVNIVGHEHINWTVRRRKKSWLVNVSVDVWNFYPVSFEDIRLAIAKGVKDGEF